MAVGVGVGGSVLVEDAVEVVGGLRLFLGGGGGGEGFEAVVELEGVGINDLAIEGCGEGERRGAFAGGGGSADVKGIHLALTKASPPTGGQRGRENLLNWFRTPLRNLARGWVLRRRGR